MNNDLVKRVAVCDMLHDEMGAWGNCADEIEALLKANDALWKIPAVDAVEVVRCRECDLQSGCKVAQRLGSDGYCSYGERKTDV